MSTRARKERKRAGVKLVKPPKVPTLSPLDEDRSRPTLGVLSWAEFLTGLLVRGRL